MDDKWQRWQAASDGLELLAAGHESQDVIGLCERVIDRGQLVAIRLREVTASDNYPNLDWSDAVEEAHSQALDAARDLLTAIR